MMPCLLVVLQDYQHLTFGKFSTLYTSNKQLSDPERPDTTGFMAALGKMLVLQKRVWHTWVVKSLRSQAQPAGSGGVK